MKRLMLCAVAVLSLCAIGFSQSVCPSGDCPNGICPVPGAQLTAEERTRKAILPWNAKRDAAVQKISGEVQQISGQVQQEQGEIANLERTIKSAALQAQPGADPAVLRALATDGANIEALSQGQKNLAGQVEQVRAAVPQAVAMGIQPVAAQVADLKRELAPLSDIQEKLDAMKTKGGAQGAVATKVEDAFENPATLRRDIYIVLGVVAVVLIVWNILHGKGLLRKQIDALAAKHPNDQNLQAAAKWIDTKEDALKDKWTGQLQALQAQVQGLTQATVATALATPAPTQPAVPPAAPTQPAPAVVVNATPSPAAPATAS